MALTPKLEIKQSQSLLLTPQLRQAISLLQMNNLELDALVEQELQNNPLLERESDRLSNVTDEKAPTIDDIGQTEDNPYQETPFSDDVEYQNDFDDYGSDCEGVNASETASWADYGKSKTLRDNDDSFDYFEQKLAQEKSLYAMLDEQISLNFASTADRLIAKILSEHLDPAGYFRGNVAEIAAKLKTSVQRIAQILQKMKTFEPSGIFAENLSECLKIQLADDNKLTPLLETLLDNLPLLAERKIKELAKLCQCGAEQLLEAAAEIKALNPKPAAGWFTEQASYVIPDVFIKRSKLGEYRVELNNMTLPRLLLNQEYYAELKKDKTASRYLKSNLNQASFLIKALNQRATTILRVAEEIVLRQYHFFEHGIEHLKPMNLKDIAETLNLNESTVSRVTANKYMSTPRGLFELKYFFSNAAGSYIGNEDTSTTAIKYKIKTLIDNENPAQILSDDKIVEILGQEGIKIARRTVTKYRESLNIPTSGRRKRAKRV